MIIRRILPVLVLLASTAAQAFPPAPDHTLYGTVRDDHGRVLTRGSAVVIVSNSAGEIVRCPIDTGAEPDVNYSLQLPMDSGTLVGLYRPTALMPAVGFTIRVIINN